MSARANLFGFVDSGAEEADLPAFAAAVDTYRTEVLTKAVGRLRAIPVTCTALTGPVWYGDGWNSAITQLEEIADYQTPDDEGYPGELERLRALSLAVRVVVRNRRERSVEEQQAEVQRVMDAHLAWEKNATKCTAPDFFQVGRTYTSGTWEFRCVALSPSPTTREPRALGWKYAPMHDVHHWHAIALDPDDWTHGGWTEITTAGEEKS